MIETMTKRLSGILNKYKLPIALQVSINKTITDEICKLCAETADTVRMIDIWTLLDDMGFTNEQVEEFAEIILTHMEHTGLTLFSNSVSF